MKNVILDFVLIAFVSLSVENAIASTQSGEISFTQNCLMCHKVNGKGGNLGPDLSKIYSRMKEVELKLKIENPKANKPTSSMPAFKDMSKADMDALIAYLKTLK